ncbi:MAG: hypothetical protein ACRCS9_11500 [Hyphomicrobium sp.]
MKSGLGGVILIASALALAGCSGNAPGTTSMFKAPAPADDMTIDPYERNAMRMRDSQSTSPPATTSSVTTAPPAATVAARPATTPAVAQPAAAPAAKQ